jgi:hypothetical protein
MILITVMIRLGVTMRAIYIEQGLSITFPGRDQEFDHGVEIGIAIALMAAGQNFTTWLSNETIDHVSTRLLGQCRQEGRN